MIRFWVIKRNSVIILYKKIPTGVGGGQANPLMFDFPFVPFNESDFNQPQCTIDPCFCDAVNIRNCKLLGMPDLNLTSQHVRDKMVIMMNRYIEIGVAGFFIDSGKFGIF